MRHSLRTLVPFVLLFGVTLMLAPSAHANERQCIWNKGGYILRAMWYRPEHITLDKVQMGEATYTPTSPKAKIAVEGKQIKIQGSQAQLKAGRGADNKTTVKVTMHGDPAYVDQFPVGQGRCHPIQDGQPYTVVLSVVGGQIAAETARIASGALVAVLGVVGEVAVCGATAGTGCKAGAAAVIAAFQGLTGAIPDAKTVFYIGTPSTTRWLDAWGTVFNPVTGAGGDIAALRPDSTGCHLWTDDFDGWCQQELHAGWGMKEKYGGDCPTGQGRAECAQNYGGGTPLKPGEKITRCHLWTDNFDGWCAKVGGSTYGMVKRGQYGCIGGQGKAICGAWFRSGRFLHATEKTGCHLWTDNFDGWCRAEFGSHYRIQSGTKGQGRCIWGQGQATCVRH